MTDFEIKLIWGCFGILLFILGFLFRWGINKVVDKMEEMNGSLNTLNVNLIKQDGDIRMMKGQIDSHVKRLDDHTIRIRQVEHNQDSCPICNKKG